MCNSHLSSSIGKALSPNPLPASFKIFSLFLIFCSVNMMCLGVVFVCFVLFCFLIKGIVG